ncbi:MAG: DUF664 domain-containing protein [Nitriliruptorales bacterium]|nr:DUF664 domain-containing protein [Nitriliruptorales bacterium]
MRLNEALQYTFGEIRDLTHRLVDGLDADALAWRPAAEANSIGWLVWHLTRIEDDHIAAIAGVDQVWSAQNAERFGLPRGTVDTGYGHRPEQVAAVRPSGAEVLLHYHDRVADMVQQYLEVAGEEEFNRVIDTSYDPPVTVGVRLISVVGDAFQHLGQTGYVRGLLHRAG